MPRPDVYDIQLMQGVNRRDSIPEMAETIKLSVASVHGKLVELQNLGFINPPRRPGVARDRSLTKIGVEYMILNGHITPEVFGT